MCCVMIGKRISDEIRQDGTPRHSSALTSRPEGTDERLRVLKR